MSQFGRWPVFITRHYSDVNGHTFSGIDVSDLILSEDNIDGNFLRISPFVIKVQLGKRKKFKAKVHITNQSDKSYVTTLQIWAAKEFLIPEAKKISINPNQSVETEFKIENIRGSEGSKYPIFVVIEYEDQGFRSFQSIYNTYNITNYNFNIVWIIFSSISGLIIIASIIFLLKSEDKS